MEKKDPLKKMKDEFKEIQGQIKELVSSRRSRRTVVMLIAAALVAGWTVSNMVHGPRRLVENAAEHAHDASPTENMWTCSMHPQIQLPKPGKCPICGMDLIPLSRQEGEGMPSERRLVMSPEAAKLAEVETAEVQRKFVSTQIRMVGKVEYDETKIAYITAWTGGRIDRLYIDQTGVPVRKGDHLAYLYSPELLAAQQEYLQSLEGAKNVKESHLDIIKSTSEDTIRNAREKLKLLGVTDEQIGELESRKVPSDHMTIYASASGIVVKREVQEGAYVQTGTKIYSIVDLSEVWIKLDAYEKDLEWLRYGQDVEFEAEAYPGEKFHGRISFIDPVLDETTRTVKVRVNVKNEDGRLKPGMFLRAVVRARVAGMGRVMAPDLEGKWICPMHPEVIQNEAGHCSVCEMPLVPTEQMGYTPAEAEAAPLVIPASAVLKTGKRAVVYIQSQHTQKLSFEGREIVLGPRAGDYYLVKSGIEEGERVVVNGNFKIDSALQIQAKPSMMNPAGGTSSGGHDHGGPAEKRPNEEALSMRQAMAPAKFLEQLIPIYEAYFGLHKALAADDYEKARASLGLMRKELGGADMNLLDEKLHAVWMDLSQAVENSIVLGLESKTIDHFRNDVFEDLSAQFIRLEKQFGHIQQGRYYEVFCPMAAGGKGAAWLQQEEAILNPFFGREMLSCGAIQETFVSRKEVYSIDDQRAEISGGSGHVH